MTVERERLAAKILATLRPLAEHFCPAPTNAELAQEFETSIPKIRSALEWLLARGLVSIDGGRNTRQFVIDGKRTAPTEKVRGDGRTRQLMTDDQINEIYARVGQYEDVKFRKSTV